MRSSEPRRAPWPVRLLLAGAMLLIVCACGGAPDGGDRDRARTPSPADRAARARAVGEARSGLSTLARDLGATARSSRTSGSARRDSRHEAAPALLLAVTGRDAGPDSPNVRQAVRTVDAVIERYQQPEGGFAYTRGGRGDDISTAFVGTYLATTYLQLRRVVGAGRLEAWRAALERAQGWLGPRSGYYVNGNINLLYATFFALMAKVRGSQAPMTQYARALDFAMNPPQRRWAGYGLKLTKRGSRRDGADGRGYFAEGLPGSRPGFDANYTLVQSTIAALLYAVTRDPSSERVLNLLTNELLKRADRSRWVIPAVQDSRHPDRKSVIGFVSPALAVSVLAGRSELSRLAPAQVHASLASFAANVEQDTGNEETIALFSAVLIAAQPPRVAAGS